MRYTNMKDMVESIRDFVKNNPTAFVEMSDLPKELCIGFKATKDDGTNVFWSLPITRLKRDDDFFTEAEHEVIKKLAEAKLAFRDAEKAYLKLFTGSAN